jgi:hypothetical protein
MFVSTVTDYGGLNQIMLRFLHLLLLEVWGGGSDHDLDHRNFEFFKRTILTMTIIPFYHQMVLVKWSKLTDISTNFKNFNNKKSRIEEIIMIKFGLTILTMKILEFLGWSWSNLA